MVCRVYTGQAFHHPLKNLPPLAMSLANSIVGTFSRLVGGASIVRAAANDHAIMYPVILGAQVRPAPGLAGAFLLDNFRW